MFKIKFKPTGSQKNLDVEKGSFEEKKCFCEYQYDLINEKKKSRCFWNTRFSGIIKRITFAVLKVTLLVFFCVFVVFPLIFKYCYALQRAVVFLNFANIPATADYEHPEKYGLLGSRNFYLQTNDGIKLGVWQILHESLVNSLNGSEGFEEALGDGRNVIIYNHGNGGCRLTSHRVEIYKELRKHFHVIAFDYRSYGDSSNVAPTEETVVNDIISVYRWVANKTSASIFLWGHSLGTSLSTHALYKMRFESRKPTGLFLESPFNNMKEEISEFPLARLFSSLPWFQYTVVEPMIANNFTFKTDKLICEVNVPVVILHAKDDRVVPFKLGYRLYGSALACRNSSMPRVQFHSFEGKNGYGHKYLCRAPEIHSIIENFVREAEELKGKN